MVAEREGVEALDGCPAWTWIIENQERSRFVEKVKKKGLRSSRDKKKGLMLPSD